MTKDKGNYAPVNGLDLYYEIHGEGEPLVMLHGGIAHYEICASPALASTVTPFLDATMPEAG